MTQKEIEEQFKKLGIPESEDIEYTDPYTFAKSLKKSFEQKESVICSSNTTVLPHYNTNNA